MKTANRIVMSVLLAMCSLAMLAADVDKGYVIEDWKYEAVVREDNTWDVMETMQVRFLEPRHGIYRYIPRRYVRHRYVGGGDAKYTYRTAVEDVWVNDSCRVSDDGGSQDNLMIRIGRADTTLTGLRTYVIRYRLAYPDDRYAASDELMHTVLGADCNTQIGGFAFSIRFEKPLPEDFASTLHVYSGPWGTDGNRLGAEVRLTGGNVLSGRIDDVPPFNAITIQGTMPEGYWTGARAVSPWPFRALVAVAAVLWCAVMCYLLLHRRRRPTVVTEYSAPEGICSAEVGVIMDDNADMEDLTSLVVWFASKGYLKIRELDGGKGLLGRKDPALELVRLRDLPDGAPEYQRLFWKALFDGGDSVNLSQFRDRKGNVMKALSALAKHFRGERSLTSVHVPSLLTALAFLVAGMVAMGRSSCVSAGDDGMWLRATLLWGLPVFVALVLRMVLSRYDMAAGRRSRILRLAALTLCGVADVLALRLLHNAPDSFLTADALTALTAGGWVVALLAGRMVRDTQYRLGKMSLLLGFREFIDKSELPMLKAQVDENPTYFYDILPYAMVFGLTKKWQRQFRDIETPVPDWYECHSSVAGTLTTYALTDRLVHGVSHTVEKAVTKAIEHDIDGAHGSSSASSSFGGGFSGGGGGGGGVGSW